MKLSDVKLIVWDLDETLWDGTLSEEKVRIKPSVIKFIEDTTDSGIVHSICSKNDYENAKAQLKDFGIWDYFVFPSIDWTPKGSRINRIISEMALRAVNVLFIDDNPQNLREASYYSEGIMTALPDDLEELIIQAQKLKTSDKNHERLKRYKVLEKKAETKSNYSSNEDFLMSCNIVVEVNEDCISEIDRIHELASRSNQLNYTKWRQDIDGLRDLIIDQDSKCGYVSVRDDFGDYGIVGFYAIKNGKALHYFFSCRTLGMLVEQYVYMLLGCPEIEVIGDVATELDCVTNPSWINRSSLEEQSKDNKASLNGAVLLKGPCDLGTVFTFIKDNENIDTEFTFINSDGVQVEGTSHLTSLVSAIEATDTEKQKSLEGIQWLDSSMLDTAIGCKQYDFIVLSLLATANLGLYRNKEYGTYIALCERCYSLTNRANWNAYINGDLFTSNIHFTEESLALFADRFEYVDEDIVSAVIRDLEIIINRIGKAKLILLLGSEIPHQTDTKLNYLNRAELHAAINRAVEDWGEGKQNVTLIHIGDYITSQEDYTDSINHFSKRVYYEMTNDLLEIINKDRDEEHRIHSGGKLLSSINVLKRKSETFRIKLGVKVRARR